MLRSMSLIADMEHKVSKSANFLNSMVTLVTDDNLAVS